jgi:hypothetical protein
MTVPTDLDRFISNDIDSADNDRDIIGLPTLTFVNKSTQFFLNIAYLT